MSPVSRILKRSGQTVTFDQSKITEAIWKAAQSVGGADRSIAEKISNQVSTVLEVFFKNENIVPTVEQIQDLVEKILIENGHAKTAKAYILYREEHYKLRQEKAKILGSHDSVIVTFPKNARLEDVKSMIELAQKIGCQIITNEPLEKKNSEIKAPLEENYRDNRQQNSIRQDNQRAEKQMNGFSSITEEVGSSCVIEEIIPPPLEIMA